MARIRSIKPEVWTDPALPDCSHAARLLYLGLANFADDHGVLADEPARLRRQILPDDPPDQVAAWLDELVAAGKVTRAITPAGGPVLVLTHWLDEQRIDKPGAPRHAPRDQLLPRHQPTADPPVPPPAERAGTELAAVVPLARLAAVPAREPSRARAVPSEGSRIPALDQGGDQGKERTATQFARPAGQAPPHPAPPARRKARGEVIDANHVHADSSAQDLVAWWLASHTENSQRRPAKRVVGQVAAETRRLLAEGFDPADLRDALDVLRDGGLHPSCLPSLATQRANGGTGWTAARPAVSAAEGHVRADLAAFGAALAAHPTDAPDVTEVALR